VKTQPGMLREKEEKLHQKDGLTNDLMLIISISRSSCPSFLMLETTPLPGTIRPQSLVTLYYMHVNTFPPTEKWTTLPLLIFLCNQSCRATLIYENLLYIGAHLCTLSSTLTCCCCCCQSRPTNSEFACSHPPWGLPLLSNSSEPL